MALVWTKTLEDEDVKRARRKIIVPLSKLSASVRILGRNYRFSSLIFTVTSTYHWIPPPAPLSKSSLKLVCNVNIVYRILKSENSQDYARISQRNCTFMNSSSGHQLMEAGGGGVPWGGRVGNKKSTQKNPKKTPKNLPKKPLKMFFWCFLGFLKF